MTAKTKKRAPRAQRSAPPKLQEFTIDRSVWRRGRNEGPGIYSQLLNDSDGMCCLGIYLKACGAAVSDLHGMSAPTSLINGPSPPGLPRKAEWLVGPDDAGGIVESEFVWINDHKTIAPSTRERKLRALFKKYGVTVHFTGEK